MVELKALVLYGPRDVRVEEVEEPRPGKGWVVVKTRLVGICGTDKAFYRGTYRPPKLPLIPGHEAVGVVVEGPEELVGKRVTTEINLVVDWSHDVCRLGMYTHCPSEVRRVLGIDFDGAMAEYFVSRAEALHDVSRISDEQAIFVEPLAAVLRAFKLHPLPPSAKVAVLGTGTIALLSAQVAKLMGSDVYVVARQDSPKKPLFKSLGVTVVDIDEAREVARQFNMGFDAVVEATGSAEGLDMALNLVRPLGIVYAKSTHGLPVKINQTKLVVNEITVIGSRCGTFREFEEAINLLASGRIRTHISAIYRLDDGAKAFEASLDRRNIKVAVKP